MVYEDGYVPDTYQCLGKKKGWYIVKIDGKTGYVHGDAVQWDGMDTFWAISLFRYAYRSALRFHSFRGVT
ncbi:MAG: hypothetical protein K2L31_00460, partial [Muribaculum sp.]|nr:hypothetical protein [Muribaculum sp.]